MGEISVKHADLRQRTLLVLTWSLLLSPAILIAGQEESLQSTKNLRKRAFAQSPAEGIQIGAAKTEWQRLRLIVLSKRLDRDLEDFESSPDWQAFLRMPGDVIILKNTANLLELEEYETKRFIGNLKMDKKFSTCTINVKN